MAQDTNTPDGGAGLTESAAAEQFAALAKAERKPPKKEETNAHVEGDDVPEDEGEQLEHDDETGEEDEEESSKGDDAEETDDEPADEPEDEEEGDDVPDDALLTIKVDGKIEKIPVKEARLGYMRQKKFTQATQAVAEERRTVEAAKTQTQGEREALRQLFESVQKTIEANAKTEGKTSEEMELLRITDPIEWAYQNEMSRQREKEAAKMAQTAAELKAKTDGERAEQHKEHLKAENAKLVEKIPEWTDTNKRNAEEAKILKYGKSIGFSDAELAGVADHRVMIALRNGMRYQTALAKKTSLVPDPKPADRRVLKPGSSEGAKAGVVAQRRGIMNSLKETGSVDDAAAAFRAFGFIGKSK